MRAFINMKVGSKITELLKAQDIREISAIVN